VRTLRNVILILAMAALATNLVTLFAQWSLAYCVWNGDWRAPGAVGLDLWAAMLSPIPWRGLLSTPAETAVVLLVLTGIGGWLAGMIAVATMIAAGWWPALGRNLVRLAEVSGLGPGFLRRGPLGVLTLLSVWIFAFLGLALLLGFGDEWTRSRTDFHVFMPRRHGYAGIGFLILAIFTATGMILALLTQLSPADRRIVGRRFPKAPLVFGSAAPAALALCLAAQARALIEAFADTARLGTAVTIHDFEEIPQSILALQAALLVAAAALVTSLWLHRLNREGGPRAQLR